MKITITFHTDDDTITVQGEDWGVESSEDKSLARKLFKATVKRARRHLEFLLEDQ